MADTQNTYWGNGSTVLYSFTFPYLETTDIKVSLNGTITTAYTLANATTIQFNTAPDPGADIRIYRQTDDSALAATFYPGSAIRSADLNDNFTQNLYVTQESNREVTDALNAANSANATATSAFHYASAAVNTASTKLAIAGGTMTGDLTLNARSDLRFADTDSSNWVAFQAPATVSSNVTWTLPSADGTANQVLSTNGSGTLSWTTPSAGNTDKIEEGNTSAEVIDTGSDGRFVVTTEGTERIRIGANGQIGLSGANYGTSGQVLTSAGSGAAPTWTTVATGGSVLYNRRPALYRGSLFYKTAATTISIVAGAVLNGHLYESATAVTMPGSFTNNTDYAIWQHPTTAALVADASFTTAPAGATGGSVVGGFHYIPSGRPTEFNNGSPTSAAEILEFSLWDLTYRPSCPDPRGMACIEGGFWMDLYLCGATSYAGSTFSAVPSSRIGLTIADGNSRPLVPAQYGGDGSTTYSNGKWYVFTEVARSFGKRLPTYDEFSAAAFGAPEASSRGSDPGTVQWERVSKFGLAQATGTLLHWGQETCTSNLPSAFTTGSETDGRGQVYGSQTCVTGFGGNWLDGSNSGSRCVILNKSPWNSFNTFGARFCCNHLVSG